MSLDRSIYPRESRRATRTGGPRSPSWTPDSNACAASQRRSAAAVLAVAWSFLQLF